MYVFIFPARRRYGTFPSVYTVRIRIVKHYHFPLLTVLLRLVMSGRETRESNINYFTARGGGTVCTVAYARRVFGVHCYSSCWCAYVCHYIIKTLTSIVLTSVYIRIHVYYDWTRRNTGRRGRFFWWSARKSASWPSVRRTHAQGGTREDERWTLIFVSDQTYWRREGRNAETDVHDDDCSLITIWMSKKRMLVASELYRKRKYTKR